jgi:hypothetical protein
MRYSLKQVYIARLFLLGNNINQPFGFGTTLNTSAYTSKTHPNIKYLIDILTITHDETVKLYERAIHTPPTTNTNPHKCPKTYFISHITIKDNTLLPLPHARIAFVFTHIQYSIPPETSKKYKWIFSILAEMGNTPEYTNDLNAPYHTIIKNTQI